MIQTKVTQELRHFLLTMASLRTLKKFEFQKSQELTFRAAFDNGHLKHNPEEARKLVDGLVSIMTDEHFKPKDPLLVTFRSIWLRLSHVGVKLFTLLFNAD